MSQLPAKMPHLSAGGVVCMMCIMCAYVLTLCCQDVSSFVSSCQDATFSTGKVVHMHVCVCVDSVLSRCLIFFLLYTCQDAPSFSEFCVCMCVYVLTLCCQDVSSFVSCLPRCPIFRQAELHVCVHVYYNVCSRLCC